MTKMIISWWLIFTWLSKAEHQDSGATILDKGNSLSAPDGALTSRQRIGSTLVVDTEYMTREQLYFSGFGTEALSSPSSSIEAPLPEPIISSSYRTISQSIPIIDSAASAPVVYRALDSRIYLTSSTSSTPSSAGPTIHPKRPPHEGSTPIICKTVVGDVIWPHYDTWKSYMPNVTAVWIEGNEAHPNYFLDARNIVDVEAAVAFASKYNIRLSVVSSGLDYSGRNDAPNGLMVSVKHMKGIEVLENPEVKEEGFAEARYTDDSATANIVHLDNGSKYGVTVGAGVTTQELNDALELSGLFSVAAAHGNITVAGGWLQGGGHGPFSYHRLAIDDVLEFQVVTGDGQLKIANQASNPDLFWALKGGGGATFGIVVQVTVNAWPDARRSVYSAWLNTTVSAPEDAIYNIAPRCFKELQKLSFIQGYCFIYPSAIRILGWTHPGRIGEDRAKRVNHRKEWITSLRAMENLGYVAPIIHEEVSYASFKEFFDGTFGMRNQARYEADDRCKRKNEWFPDSFECLEMPTIKMKNLVESRNPKSRADMIDPYPLGITKVDSWLLAREHLSDKKLPGVLRASMPRYDNDTIIENVPLAVQFIQTSANGESRGGNSMHSAWRSSDALVSGTNLTALRAFAPYMAAYLNEASIPYENFKRAFWGDSYDRLLSIKLKYDPKDVFFVTPGIGADEWWVDAARLCRHERKPDQEVPDPFIAVPLEGVILDPTSETLSSSTGSVINVTRQVEMRTSEHSATQAPQSRRTIKMPFSKSTVVIELPPPGNASSSPTVVPQGSLTTVPYTYKPYTPSPRPTAKPNTISVINLSDLKTMTNTTSSVYTLPYPEGDNTNTNPSPLAKYLLPGPFVTPWPANQASADNYQRSALARLSTMRESSLREKGFSQFGYSYVVPGVALTRPTISPTAYIPINLTPKMPAWSPMNGDMASPAPQFTTVPAESISVDYRATTTTGLMSSWSGPIRGTTTSYDSDSASSSSSATVIASRPKAPSSVSGPGGRPAAVPKPKIPTNVGPGGRLTEDITKPQLDDMLSDDSLQDDSYFLLF